MQSLSTGEPGLGGLTTTIETGYSQADGLNIQRIGEVTIWSRDLEVTFLRSGFTPEKEYRKPHSILDEVDGSVCEMLHEFVQPTLFCMCTTSSSTHCRSGSRSLLAVMCHHQSSVCAAMLSFPKLDAVCGRDHVVGVATLRTTFWTTTKAVRVWNIDLLEPRPAKHSSYVTVLLSTYSSTPIV